MKKKKKQDKQTKKLSTLSVFNNWISFSIEDSIKYVYEVPLFHTDEWCF